MGNFFTGGSSSPNYQQPQFNQPNQPNTPQMTTEQYQNLWAQCQQNPVDFLAKNNVNVPQQYQGSLESIGRYALSQMGSGFMQKANPFIGMFGKMFGIK